MKLSIAGIALILTACQGAPMAPQSKGAPTARDIAGNGAQCAPFDTWDRQRMADCDNLAYQVCDELAASYGLRPHENPLGELGFECVLDAHHYLSCDDIVGSDPGYAWPGPDGVTYCIVPFTWGDV